MSTRRALVEDSLPEVLSDFRRGLLDKIRGRLSGFVRDQVNLDAALCDALVVPTNMNWVSRGWGYRAVSLDNLMTAISRVGTLTPGRRYVWRGASDWRWDVLTSLQRYIGARLPHLDPLSADVNRLVESALVKQARQWGLDEAGQMTEQAVIALMQHHGLPTRFLDVTSDPMTALWFATERANGLRDASGILFAFDVTGLRELVTAGRFPATWGSIENPDWHYSSEVYRAYRESKPFLVVPTVRDARMVAQQGLFLAGAPRDKGGVPGLDAFSMIADPPGEGALQTLFASDRKRGRPGKLPFVALIVPSSLPQAEVASAPRTNIQPQFRDAVSGHFGRFHACRSRWTQRTGMGG